MSQYYIFNQIRQLKQDIIELISVQSGSQVEESFIKLILYERKPLEDDEFIGNISDGTSQGSSKLARS